MDRIYVRYGDREHGPLTVEQLRRKWARGRIPADSECRPTSEGGWQPVTGYLRRLHAGSAEHRAGSSSSSEFSASKLPPLLPQPRPMTVVAHDGHAAWGVAFVLLGLVALPLLPEGKPELVTWLGGAIALCLSMIVLRVRSVRRLYRQGRVTNARVLSCEEKDAPGGGKYVQAELEYSFEGRDYRKVGRYSHHHRGLFEAGNIVALVVDPKRPTTSYVYHTMQYRLG